MNKKGIILIVSGLLLLGACNSNDNPSSIKEEDLIIDVTFPKNEEENYEWKEKEFKEFPTYPSIGSNLKFTLSDNQQYYIVERSSDRSISTIIIPETYNDKPVKEIKSEGFAYLNLLNTIYIPSSITTIGAGAFNGTALKTVYYNAKNVSDLNARNWAFYPSNFQEIDFYVGPEVERIPARLFFPLATDPSVIPHLKHVYFDPNSKVQEIGEYAFYKSIELKSVSLPDSIKKIGNYAFYESGVEDIIMPNECLSIGDYAFANSGLKHIKWNEKINSLGRYSFYRCQELEYLNLKDTSLESLSDYAFASCFKLKTLQLPKNLKSIGVGAFEENTSLKYLYLHDNVEVINDEAFSACQKLEAIYLGQNLKTLGASSFADCFNVKKLMIYSTHINDLSSSNGVFKNLGKDENDLIVIFMKSTYIPSNLFYSSALKEEQPHIKQMIIDTSIKEIGENAFFNLEVKKIDYLGKVSQWNQIKIHDYNTILNDVNCHNNNVQIKEN